MTQNIYYHSKNEESELSEEALHQSKVKTQQDKPPNPGVPCLMSKDLYGFAACKMDLSAQGGFQFLYDVLFGRYPMALAPLTSWSHQCNPDFLHAWAQWLSLTVEENSTTHFLVHPSWLWSQNWITDTVKVWLSTWYESWSSWVIFVKFLSIP